MKRQTTCLAILCITAFSFASGCGDAGGGNAVEKATPQQLADYEAAEKAAQEQMRSQFDAGMASQKE